MPPSPALVRPCRVWHDLVRAALAVAHTSHLSSLAEMASTLWAFAKARRGTAALFHPVARELMHAAGRSLEGGGRGPKPQGERCRDWVQSTREYHFRQKDRQEEIKHAPLSQVPHCDNVSISRKISGGCAVVLRGVLLEEDSFLERDHRSSGRFICANRQSKRQPLAKDERFSSLVALSELGGG